MSTIVNTPASGESNSGMGFVLGIILLIAFVFLMMYFGLPMLRNVSNTVPQAPQIQVPDKIDVNVQTPK